MQTGAERPNDLVVWGPQTLKTLMVLGFFERESVERTGCGGSNHWDLSWF